VQAPSHTRVAVVLLQASGVRGHPL
jgi:hypothetical protein